MNEEVIQIMEEAEEPFLRLGEIADELDVSKSAVLPRLEELEEEGEVYRKQVGARAVIWWLPERY